MKNTIIDHYQLAGICNPLRVYCRVWMSPLIDELNNPPAVPCLCFVAEGCQILSPQELTDPESQRKHPHFLVLAGIQLALRNIVKTPQPAATTQAMAIHGHPWQAHHCSKRHLPPRPRSNSSPPSASGALPVAAVVVSSCGRSPSHPLPAQGRGFTHGSPGRIATTMVPDGHWERISNSFQFQGHDQLDQLILGMFVAGCLLLVHCLTLIV